jgi:hypothetical protein
MPSVYASQVEAYGRRWHRPWVVLFILLTSFWVVDWLTHQLREETQPVCEPRAGSRYRAAVEIDGLLWTADVEAALACALNRNRRVLVAFHGVTDVNAKLNETMFRERVVKAGLKRYVLVMLYTDYVPADYYRRAPTEQERREDAMANQEFERLHFRTVQAPMYVILQPKRTGKFEVVGSYEVSLFTDSARFVRFLRDPRRPPDEAFWGNFINKLSRAARVP